LDYAPQSGWERRTEATLKPFCFCKFVLDGCYRRERGEFLCLVPENFSLCVCKEGETFLAGRGGMGASGN
jgi:hypothetical protein